MKKISLFLCICASLILFVNASVWEGTAAAALGGELPETGLYIATNSFPGNTVVDVTNLENGRTTRAIVSSGLETSGLLAVLSRDAANAIGIGSTLGRIRMSQPLDPMASSRFTGVSASNETAGNGRFEDGELIVDLPDTDMIPRQASMPAEESQPEIPQEPEFELSLVPAEARPPENDGPEPDPYYMIPGISPAPPEPSSDYFSDYMDPRLFVDPISPPAEEFPMAYEVIEPVYYFSAPIISNLEKGKYYLQIAAYSKAETVQSEISKIDSNLPVAIMNAGTDDRPIYRILIGPVNLGESGALLQRFKSSYQDAFVRVGS